MSTTEDMRIINYKGIKFAEEKYNVKLFFEINTSVESELFYSKLFQYYYIIDVMDENDENEINHYNDYYVFVFNNYLFYENINQIIKFLIFLIY